MTSTAGWAGIPSTITQVQFRRVMTPLERPVPPQAEIVTAYTDGAVTKRSLRAKVGYHEAADLSSYQGVEPGDFVVHGLDILRGSVGVSDSQGAMSAVCTVCRPACSVDGRYVAYAIRMQAQSGFTRALARGVREGGADFRRWDTLATLPVPLPPLAEQRRIADFLDDQVARIDNIVAAREKQAEHVRVVRQESLRDAIEGTPAPLVPLYTAVRWREGPGILAKDFRTDGVPILRIMHLRTSPPSLEDCDFVDEADGLGRWRHFLTEVGELILSGSASVGELAVWVTPDIANAIPYTGLIKVRANSRVIDPEFMRAFFSSRVFGDQIDLLKSGIGIQHWGPSHLSQVRIPLPSLAEQIAIATEFAVVEESSAKCVSTIASTIALLNELKRSLITAAVTGEFDASAADGSRVPV